MSAKGKVKIAHLAGPTATIQNSPPLVTSNKARANTACRRERPRRQRSALRRVAPATAGRSRKGLCRIASRRIRSKPTLPNSTVRRTDISMPWRVPERAQHPDDKAVFEIEIHPEDGLYPMPYMARQANGQAWEANALRRCAREQAGKASIPTARAASRKSTAVGRRRRRRQSHLLVRGVDFYRVLPTGGYTKGLPAARRTDMGEGDIPPETRSKDFFAYRPFHLGEAPPARRWRKSPMPRGAFSPAGNMTARSIPRAARKSRRSPTGSICSWIRPCRFAATPRSVHTAKSAMTGRRTSTDSVEYISLARLG